MLVSILTYDFHITARLHNYRRSSWRLMEGEGAKAKDMISPSTSLLLLDWEEVEEEGIWVKAWRKRRMTRSMEVVVMLEGRMDGEAVLASLE